MPAHLFTPQSAQKASSSKHVASIANVGSDSNSTPKHRAFTSWGMRQMSARFVSVSEPEYAVDIYANDLYIDHMTHLQTVVELDSFLKRAKAIMSDAERMGVVTYLAANPEAGIPLGGGLRKVRVPRVGGGKSGGYRTLHVFGGMHMPLFLLTVFAKNEKDNLSAKEQADLVETSKRIIAAYGDRQ